MKIIKKGIKISYILMLIKAILMSLPIGVGIILMFSSLGIFEWVGDVFGGNTHSATAGFEVLFSSLAGFAGLFITMAALILIIVFGVAFTANFISFLHSKKIYGRVFLNKGEKVKNIKSALIADCIQRIVLTVIDGIWLLLINLGDTSYWELCLPILIISVLFFTFQVFLILKCKKMENLIV